MKSRKKQAIAVFLVMGITLAAGLPYLDDAPVGEAKININTAGVEQLCSLPRIGVKVAQRIIDFRKKNGPFKRIEGLLKVKGIGEKTFLRMKDRITI